MKNKTHKPLINIKVISDPICPWCFIGKRNLDIALNKCDFVLTNIEWLPYQLNLYIPKNGMNRQKYLNDKFGGKEKADKIYEYIYIKGKEVNINFKFADISIMPNSSLAHILINFAKKYKMSSLALELLFEAFFEKGQNIGDIEILLNIASQLGIDKRKLLKELLDKDIRKKIENNAKFFYKEGINGVPFFIFNDEHCMSGVQPLNHLINLFTNVIDK